jgi:hypothetical protein
MRMFAHSVILIYSINSYLTCTRICESKDRSFSWVGWHVPVVTATWEALVGGLLKPMSFRSTWTTLTDLHLKKKREREKELHVSKSLQPKNEQPQVANFHTLWQLHC